MRVLRHVHRLCRPGGVILDLTTVPPAASVEHAGGVLGRLDQDRFLTRAAITEEAVERLVVEGLLREEGSDRHDVLKHFGSGAELLSDVAGRPYSRAPADLVERLTGTSGAVVERSSCLLRRLRVLRPPT